MTIPLRPATGRALSQYGMGFCEVAGEREYLPDPGGRIMGFCQIYTFSEHQAGRRVQQAIAIIHYLGIAWMALRHSTEGGN